MNEQLDVYARLVICKASVKMYQSCTCAYMWRWKDMDGSTLMLSIGSSRQNEVTVGSSFCCMICISILVILLW